MLTLQDRNVFTDEVFQRFEALRQSRVRYNRTETPEAQSGQITDRIVSEPTPLRFAYTSFALTQCLLVLVLYQTRMPGQTSVGSIRSNITHPLASFVSSISLSVLFFLSRNVKYETRFHRSLAVIFVFRSIVLGSALIRGQFAF